MRWPWYSAMTLTERARFHCGANALLRAWPVDMAWGGKRLTKWKSQSPFDTTDLFVQRLDQAGVSEAELLELLGGQPTPELLESTEPPAWAAELHTSLTEPAKELLRIREHGSETEPKLQLLELFGPLIARQIERFQGLSTALPCFCGMEPSDVKSTQEVFIRALLERLQALLLKTMSLELNVARLRGQLQGENGEERFKSFISWIRQPQTRLELLSEYPVLGRQMVTAVDQWLRCSLQFLERWGTDLPAIADSLCLAKDPGPISGIVSDVGDKHRGGQSVWIVQCRSGFKVVYKPRSLEVDQHFQELLLWLNDKGASPPFRTMRVLNRGNYGWEEHVSPATASSREEVSRCYQRLGGYLALLYALAATDFHHENLIVAGEYPILIDLEALFHPLGFEPTFEGASDLAGRSFMKSVLGSGLLPVPTWSESISGAFDISGLGAAVREKTTMTVSSWQDLGTDRMRLVSNVEVTECSSHRPKLDGVAVEPLEFLEEIQCGFQTTYQLLSDHREELLDPDSLLERFANDEVRVVLRNTSSYGDLLAQGFHPDVMRDALDLERLFDRLWEEVKDRPSLAHLIQAEREALWRGDIPIFTTKPKSRDLWGDSGQHFKEVLEKSGLECARARLRLLGPEDLKQQLWFLRASLTTLASRARASGRPRKPPQPTGGPPLPSEAFLEASCSIGDCLAATAFRTDAEVAWIGLRPMLEQQWLLVPLGLDLYDGIPGVGLFLAYLGAISKRERYTSLARATLTVLRRRLRPEQRKKGPSELGGFTGWGGAVYTLAHLGVLWNEPELLDEAEAIVETLPRRIEDDKELDIIGGAAGCIAGLLCLYACRRSARVLKVAEECGAHLISKAQPMPQGLGWPSPFPCNGPLTGFSHGAAGISWALLELAAQSGQERFRRAALGGICYERSLFSSTAGNWPDLRLTGREDEAAPADSLPHPVAWCHGAPGIGLARLLCRKHLEDPLLEPEIEAALNTTVALGFGHNHCLCHGDLGNLELILEAARTWPDSGWRNKASGMATGILQGISRDGWTCGNPLRVESPGLMTGLAGIGYGLLRCAEPSRVPSVLSLAPPVQRTTSAEETMSPSLQGRLS